jgi:hypothetical protein
MSEKNKKYNTGSRGTQMRGVRPHVPVLVKKLVKQRWARVSPVFFVGTVVTAAGSTTIQNDTVIFIGMIIMGLGVVTMWIAETGKPRLVTLPGPLVFIAGTVLTALSLTLIPTNPLLCAGMIATGIGTIAMWLVYVGKLGVNSLVVALLFTAGVITEAVSLTVYPSDLYIMIGMIITGIGAFGMWAFELVLDSDEEKSADEAGE